MTLQSRIAACLAMVCGLGGHVAAAGPALLFDMSNGKVLYAEDQDDQWHPASLTKIMTAYLTFEALKAGRLTPDQKISVSEKAFAEPPSKLGLPVGAEITVDLAIRVLIVKSANDVAVMLAEAIGGDEDGFVKMMNDTAQRLGMTRTHFVNANGLPADGQVVTARDLAKLTRAVLRDFPDRTPLWAMADVRVGRRRLHTHNGLLRSYGGADGMKTGFICDAGYNVVASATREGHKLVAVVLGEHSGRDRSVRAASLLEHGFETLGWKQIFAADTVDTMPMTSDAKPVVSIRNSIVSWGCGGKHPRRRVIARKKRGVHAAAASGKTQVSAEGGAAAAATSQAAPKAKGKAPSKVGSAAAPSGQAKTGQ